jgi:hypothetical protein
MRLDTSVIAVTVAVSVLAACDEPASTTPPPPVPMPRLDAGPQALVSERSVDAGESDAGPGDFRSQRMQMLGTRSSEFSPSEALEVIRNRRNPGFDNGRWGDFLNRPHSDQTIAALCKAFDELDDNARVDILNALDADHTPETKAFFADVERRANDTWIPPIMASHRGEDGAAWRAGKIGQSPTWDVALVEQDHQWRGAKEYSLSNEALEHVFHDARDPIQTRVLALSLMSPSPSPAICKEALASTAVELQQAAITSTCEFTRAFLETLSTKRGPLHQVAAQRLLDRGIPGADDTAQAEVALRLLSDESLRPAAMRWWWHTLKVNEEFLRRSDAKAAAALHVLEHALDDRKSPAAKMPQLFYDAGAAEELQGNFAAALARYKQLLALPATLLDPAHTDQENLSGLAHLRIARIALAQGQQKDMEAALHAMEFDDPPVSISDRALQYSGLPKQVAAQFREDSKLPLKVSVALNKERTTATVRLTNRSDQPLEVGLVEAADNSATRTRPIRVLLKAGFDIAGETSAYRAPPARVTLAPGESVEVDVPLYRNNMPKTFELQTEVEVGLPPGMGRSKPDGRVTLQAISEVH